MSLREWGWDDDWAASVAGLDGGAGAPVRVVGQGRDRWVVQTGEGPALARSVTRSPLDPHPVVGDWVLAEAGPTASDPLSVLRVIPRRSSFTRGSAGDGSTAQVLAANVDVVWILHGLDLPLNPRRLERYLAIAWESGAVPEVVLTKADLSERPDLAVADVQELAVGVTVRVVSVADPESVARLGRNLRPGRTVVLLGPSGVGKSTLVNSLGPERIVATGPVREKDAKGRHTTTSRELFQVSGGALLLDTPGIRELRVWSLVEGLGQTFPEIEEMARGCRYRDCRHESEPGCAVLEAERAGSLDPSRLASYRKLQAEAAYQERKTDARARQAALSEHKSALKTVKFHHKFRGPG